jgi:hypothetical protein
MPRISKLDTYDVTKHWRGMLWLIFEREADRAFTDCCYLSLQLLSSELGRPFHTHDRSNPS